MRVTVPVPDRSTSSSLSTTAASSVAPTIHGARIARRADSHISTSAVTVHSSVMPVCTASESHPGVDAIRHAAEVVEGADQHRVEPDEAGDSQHRRVQRGRARQHRAARRRCAATATPRAAPRRRPGRAGSAAARCGSGRAEPLERCWRAGSTAAARPSSTARRRPDRPRARHSPASAVRWPGAAATSAAQPAPPASRATARRCGVAPVRGDCTALQRTERGQHQHAQRMHRLAREAPASAARPSAAPRSGRPAPAARPTSRRPASAGPAGRGADATPSHGSGACAIAGTPTCGQCKPHRQQRVQRARCR